MTTIKTCFRCQAEKPITEFYKHPKMGDGRLGKCKDCTKIDVRANRRKRDEYYAEYDRKRGSRQSNTYQREYVVKNPDKYAAHTALGNAIRDGRLIREPCFFCCSTENVEGHHPDYSKPLSVIWMCSKCHKRMHAHESRVTEIKGE